MPKSFQNISERIDRVGSTVLFDYNGTPTQGKIVKRKDNGKCLVLCLHGTNKGNTKLISPDDIHVNTDESVSKLIESELESPQIVNSIIEFSMPSDWIPAKYIGNDNDYQNARGYYKNIDGVSYYFLKKEDSRNFKPREWEELAIVVQHSDLEF